MDHDVFISYSSPDKAVAEAVCTALEAKQIKCWIAPRDIPAGMTWVDAIVDAIDECRLFVLVLSATSNNSPQVLSEAQRVAGKNIPIIPLRIDDTPLSKAMDFYTSRYQWLDARTPPLEKHLQQLVLTAQRLLSQDALFKARKQAEEVAKEKTRLEAIAAQEKAKHEAEKAKKAQEAETRARQEAEIATREQERLEMIAAREKAKLEAEEARKKREEIIRARKESEAAAKEKQRLNAISAREKAKQDANDAKKDKEAALVEKERVQQEASISGNKDISPSWFRLWAGVIFLAIGLFVLIMAGIENEPANEHGFYLSLLIVALPVTIIGVLFLWRALVKAYLNKGMWLWAASLLWIIWIVVPSVVLNLVLSKGMLISWDFFPVLMLPVVPVAMLGSYSFKRGFALGRPTKKWLWPAVFGCVTIAILFLGVCPSNG